jgi:FdhE protein
VISRRGKLGTAGFPLFDSEKDDSLKELSHDLLQTIGTALTWARARKPAYGELYPLLEELFLIQARAREAIRLQPLELGSDLIETKWKEGFPLLRRWDFPVDIQCAEEIRLGLGKCIPESNRQLRGAFDALSGGLEIHREHEEEIWRSFLQHEWEPWEEWVETGEIDAASLIFLARSCLRPSIEWTARDLLRRFPLPRTWLRGYCPVCGSLPALLVLQDQGERQGYCSWCGTTWELHRLQCPYCDNRCHDSLGYMYAEDEPQYRVQYCRPCKSYFKLIDAREMLDPPYLPLEEWTTLHLDLLAQKSGWNSPPSPSPAVYGDGGKACDPSS